MAEETAAPEVPAKVDPEAFALRGKPQVSARFRRGIIIGAAAAGSCGIATLGFVALRPHIHMAADQPSDLSSPAGTATPDALSSLPSSYGNVPKLGPPLPGDLGKPILEHQQASFAAAPVSQSSPGENAEIAEQQRAVDDLRAARQSGLLVQTRAEPSEAKVSMSGADAGSTPASAPSPAALDPANDPNGQLHKVAFVSGADRSDTINPHVKAALTSPYTLSAGTIIAGSLITGLRSDLPGLVTAQVTENVFDTATGRLLLIPQGARLIGSYDSVVAFGQRRALVVWQRIIWPDGSSLAIDNVPGADPSGYSGLEDRVDFHTWRLLKGVAISTLLGVGAQLQFTGGSDLVEAVRESTQQNIARAGDQITSKTLNIQPSITIRPGAPIRLIVHRDLVIPPMQGA
jgi:type IV secretion system protein TrbI